MKNNKGFKLVAYTKKVNGMYAISLCEKYTTYREANERYCKVVSELENMKRLGKIELYNVEIA